MGTVLRREIESLRYRLVARRVHQIDPSLARTLANATFASSVPLRKAMEHIERVMGTVRN